MDKEIYKKIVLKKEFSKLPKKDVEMSWKVFEKRQDSDEEKIRLTRDLLRKVFSVFTSNKLLSLKNKDPEWVLKKHISTKERLPYYEELYGRLLEDFKESITIFDLGGGVNGFSYGFFKKKLNYVNIESMGQLVNLQNYYFKTRGLQGRAVHESLFNLEKIKKYLSQERGKKLVFLFKVLDSLEMVEKNYSKKFLRQITPLVDRVVISFATRSLVKRTKFKATRNWLYYFIKENFEIIEDFELGAERYISFENK